MVPANSSSSFRLNGGSQGRVGLPPRQPHWSTACTLRLLSTLQARK